MANKNAKKIAVTFNRDNPREAEMLAYIESKVSMSIYIKQLILDKMVSEGYFNSTPNVPNTQQIPPRYVSNTNQVHTRDRHGSNKVHTEDIPDTQKSSTKGISNTNQVVTKDIPDTNIGHTDEVSDSDDFNFDDFIIEEEVVEEKKSDDSNKNMMNSLFNSMNSMM